MNRAAKEAGGLWAPGVDQHLQDGTCGEAEIQEGQVREERIHWGVEPGVPHGQQNDERVAHQSQKVGNKDNHRVFFQVLGVQRSPEGGSPQASSGWPWCVPALVWRDEDSMF